MAPNQLLVEHASRGILVDTNLLLLFAAGSFDPRFVQKFKRTQKYTVDDFDWVDRCVSRFHRIITTPHILAEVSNLGLDRADQTRQPFMPSLLEVIRRTKELHVAKTELLDTDYLPRIGITDAAIVALARREKYLVLTDDFPLSGYLQYFGCDVVNLNHIRSIEWGIR